MADALPDYTYERKRLERQRRQISITMLDQKIQLLDIADERERLRAQEDELRQAVKDKPQTKATSERERLAQQMAEMRQDLAVFDVDLRMTEIAGIEKRLVTNIEASERALADLDVQIAQMPQ